MIQPDGPRFSFRRVFLEETLAAFPGSRLEMWPQHAFSADGQTVLPVDDVRRYARLKVERPEGYWFWMVQRKAVGQAIAS